MLPRTLEPEVMDSAEEAQGYDAMDHDAVNHRFVDDFLAVLGPAADDPRMSVLDVGAGTAQIPIRLARAAPALSITAIDLAAEMLRVARENVVRERLEDRIRLLQRDAKRLPDPDGAYASVISNSIVHHIPEPAAVFREMRRVLRPGGVWFVRDLLRPDSSGRVEDLVAAYAGEADAHQRRMFRESLHAALTLAEVRGLAGELGLPPESVTQTSDRHWTLAARV
ncbi:MAG: class I SAM-dependent methyltransferase [Planctomyces sp.]|nr:class I SAM-dependent methyltransferase [Planctomyces sp.]